MITQVHLFQLTSLLVLSQVLFLKAQVTYLCPGFGLALPLLTLSAAISLDS